MMTARPWIIPLKNALDISLVGGKAVNLARMLNLGLPVPNGFVVTTEAYRLSGQQNTLSAELKSQIADAYKNLAFSQVAVRSSATAEDMSGASMAGQYETFLNLSSEQEVLDAVCKCWKSIQSERVATYLKQNGILPHQVAMAVVVQELVPADAAGVLFTANPNTGSSDEMVIEAAWGLGEAVVSGSVQPDIIRLEYQECKVLDYRTACKDKYLSPEGRHYSPVPPERKNKACLNYEQIRGLWTAARKINKNYDTPQDIEWAVVKNQIFILQTRPITTLHETKMQQKVLSEIPRTIQEKLNQGQGPWVRHNIGETLPNPTPLSWQILRQFMSGDGGFGNIYKQIGFAPSPEVCKDGFLDCIAGHLYMDCSRMPEMFFKGYPFRYDVESLRSNPDAAQQPPTIPCGKLSQLRQASRAAQKALSKLHELSDSYDSFFENEFIPELLCWCQKQECEDWSILDDESLISCWQSACSVVMDRFGSIAFMPSMIEAMAVADLTAFLEEHLWNESASQLLQTLTVSSVPDKTLLAGSELLQVARGTRKREQWLNDHGHRAVGEFDLAAVRWKEQPERLEPLIKQLENSDDIMEIHHKRYQQAQSCAHRIEASLPRNLKKEFACRLDVLVRYCRFREDGKYHLMHAFWILRKMVLEFAERLKIGDAVFYLYPEEMIASLRTGFVPEDKIQDRMLRRKAHTHISLPHVIDNSFIQTFGQPESHIKSVTNKAYPVSGGRGNGPAKIVFSPETVTELGKGYILVCPSTDPSWTPLFVNAAGLILEQGGTLSHGAVVAREMGIPAVILENATSLFQQDELLGIDGAAGLVYRLQDKDNIPAEDDDQENPILPHTLIPPMAGTKEHFASKIGLLTALIWGVFLAAVYVLPAPLLREPVMRVLDTILWPLIPRLGMVWTVALIGAVFGFVPLLIQRFLCDHQRLIEVKTRSNRLIKLAEKLPKNSPRRQSMEKHASISFRLLKASMTPLGILLGPIILVFLWLPERVDPSVWNAQPGRTVNILAELNADLDKPVTLRVPDTFEIDSTTPAEQSIAPIRKELQQMLTELQASPENTESPWDQKIIAEQIRKNLISSLKTFLQAGMPPQKLGWNLRIPDNVNGIFPVQLVIQDQQPVEYLLVFGDKCPPVSEQVTPHSGPVINLKAVYLRPLQQPIFWAPLACVGGPKWDFGWLGVYVISYLLVMVLVKRVLNIP